MNKKTLEGFDKAANAIRNLGKALEDFDSQDRLKKREELIDRNINKAKELAQELQLYDIVVIELNEEPMGNPFQELIIQELEGFVRDANQYRMRFRFNEAYRLYDVEIYSTVSN